MARKTKRLSEEEIWDDSALVNSWNEALEEYKLYHSIHASGERVEDVIQNFGKEGIDPEVANGLDSTDVIEGMNAVDADEEIEDGEWQEDDDVGEDMKMDPSSQTLAAGEEGITSSTSQNEQQSVGETGLPTITLPVPEPIPGQGKDDAMKQLMMSWYWAGYYTGFYQGQQQSAS